MKLAWRRRPFTNRGNGTAGQVSKRGTISPAGHARITFCPRNARKQVEPLLTELSWLQQGAVQLRLPEPGPADDVPDYKSLAESRTGRWLSSPSAQQSSSGRIKALPSLFFSLPTTPPLRRDEDLRRCSQHPVWPCHGSSCRPGPRRRLPVIHLQQPAVLLDRQRRISLLPDVYIGRGYPEFQEELRRKGPSPVLHHLCAEPEVLLRRAWQRVGRGRLVRVGLCVGHVDSGRDGLDRYCSVLDGRTRGLGSVAFVRSKHAFHVVCGLKSWVRPVESLSAVDGGQDC